MRANNATMTEKRRRHIRRGFTMIELMAMMIIIGLIATLVSSKTFGLLERARINTTKASLRTLHSAVLQFKMDTGRYPNELEGLSALIKPPSDVVNYLPGGYLETIGLPRDGWNTEFVYKLSPEINKPFMIISYGPDQKEGGEDDLYSTSAY